MKAEEDSSKELGLVACIGEPQATAGSTPTGRQKALPSSRLLPGVRRHGHGEVHAAVTPTAVTRTA